MIGKFKGNINIYYGLYLIPLFFVFSKFLLDFTISLISLHYLIYNREIHFKKFYKFHSRFIYFFLIFWIYLVISNIFLENLEIVGKKLIFYFRFLILVALINFYFDRNIRIEFFLKFFICLILLLQFDIIFQHFFGFDILGYP